MTERAQVRAVRHTPDDLVDAVRAGRIRHPGPWLWSAPQFARTLDGLMRGYPVRPILLWVEPHADEPAQWVIDGGDLVTALLAASGDVERPWDDEPIHLDADTGEIVAWQQRDMRHELLDVVELISAADRSALLEAERLDQARAVHAQRLRDVFEREALPVQIVELARTELPRLLRQYPLRRGVTMADIEPEEAVEGPPASFFRERPPTQRSRAESIFSKLVPGLSAEDGRRLLLVAEGRDPDTLFEPESAVGLPDDGRPAVLAVREADPALRGVVGFGRGQLLPDLASIASVARFLRVFGDVVEEARPLLRRWLWRQALTEGEIDVSPSALAPIEGDPVAALVRLLERTPAPPLRPPGRDEMDLTSRYGRLVLLGMASLHPRDLGTGVLVDAEEMKPKPIFPHRPAEAANLVLTDHPWVAGARTVDRAIAQAAALVLASHGIDGVAVTFLRAGDEDAFLARRAAYLDEAVVEFWTTRTEPAAAVRIPVAALFADEADA